MSFPKNFKLSDVDDIGNTVPETVSNVTQLVSINQQEVYIDRNRSGVLELDTNSDKVYLAVPLRIDYVEPGMYNQLINTAIEYFAEPTVTPIGRLGSSIDKFLDSTLSLNRADLDQEPHYQGDGPTFEKQDTFTPITDFPQP